MSEHTTNSTKTLAGRFLKMYSDQKTLKPVVCDFFAKNLSITELAQRRILCYEVESFTKNTFL